MATTQAAPTAAGAPQPPKEKIPEGGETQQDYKLVTFAEGDPGNPKNWSKGYKWYCTMVVAITCFVVAFCSSVITADVDSVAHEFGISHEAALLPITVFVVGFGVGKFLHLGRRRHGTIWVIFRDLTCYDTGPMVFAPLSEVYGRQIIYGTTLLLAVVFIIPCAVSKNIGTLIVCRLIDGIAFSAPMTLVGGTLADLWRNEERGVPMAAFSAAPFIGPASKFPYYGFLLSIVLEYRSLANTDLVILSWSSRRWLALSRRLALALLDPAHPGLRRLGPHFLHRQGNLRPHYPRSPGRETPQADG